MTFVTKIQEQLEGIDIRFKELLKTYTYTKVGGRADYLVLPRNRYEMARVVVLSVIILETTKTSNGIS